MLVRSFTSIKRILNKMEITNTMPALARTYPGPSGFQAWLLQNKYLIKQGKKEITTAKTLMLVHVDAVVEV